MKYAALLRGINVGGNSIIKMADLKKLFEDIGFKNVSTYINSGNIIFESDENIEEITNKLKKDLLKTLNFSGGIFIRSYPQLKKIIDEVPKEWKRKNDLRCYISFVKESLPIKEVASQVEVKEGIDFVDIGKSVLYLSTKLEGLTKSSFTKLIGKKIYQDMTMRNFNTSQKILSLMEKS